MYVIDGREFDWDENKHWENINKHGVTFREAATAINHPNAISEHDDEHSHYEVRYKVTGYSKQSRLLLVCHCLRNGKSITRIFSARRANKAEQNEYFKEVGHEG